jgi:phosphohistidine phosphatase
MMILLVRHGRAVEEAPGLGDEGRWLTAKGRKRTRKVARWLGAREKRTPTAIWTSPLVRAVQTAEIVAAEIGLEGEVEACEALRPGRDPGDLVARLHEQPKDGVLALVGHEPSLSLIAGALLGEATGASLRKSGVACVAWDEGRGALRFVLDPAEMTARKTFEPKSPKAPVIPS